MLKLNSSYITYNNQKKILHNSQNSSTINFGSLSEQDYFINNTTNDDSQNFEKNLTIDNQDDEYNDDEIFANLTADQALNKLKKGNQNFQKMNLKKQKITSKRMELLENKQKPFATIITCSDSRLEPSVIFDQPLGSLFEIRNAGNVLNDDVIASVEYAIVHLNVKLVVILGHQNCGAVTSALAHNDNDTIFLQKLHNTIEPAIKAFDENKEDDILTQSIKNNANLTKQGLIEKDPIIKDFVENQGGKIICGYYSLKSGKAQFYE